MELLLYMKLRSPYGINSSPSFGIIPTIFLWLYIESPNGPMPLSFLFDTGAEVTSFPASVADKLEIDLDRCPEEPMTGYEGTTVFVYRSQVRLMLNRKIFEIPCVFNPIEDVPILLGRAGIIDSFNITLDGKNKQITFEEFE